MTEEKSFFVETVFGARTRGAPWTFWHRYPTEGEARAALMQLGKEGQQGEA